MISFGTLFLELVFGQLDRLPGPGEEVFTDEFAISCGGAITSATAAAAGGARAGMCTVLGEDLGSQLAIEQCAASGIDISSSARIDRPAAGITVVLNFAGDRGFVTHLPPSPQAERHGVDRWLAVLREYRPAWCYLHAGRGVPRFLREARELGCKVVLDISLGDEREGDIITDCVRLADIFVPNADELARLTGEGSFEQAMTAAAAWGTQLVVTRGAAGAVVSHPDGSFTEVTAGVREVDVKDLTGAGDNFAGALIAALHAGASITEAVVEANAAGSLAVGQLGAIGQIGAATGAGWPLRPMVLEQLIQPELMERG
ncbi:MAG TPA: carbohydrate kinase family protein [Streptosporangiaceae bacterium]|nr:carbohydrate kinase family protein [Streptosporangiaceae bacterium]